MCRWLPALLNTTARRLARGTRKRKCGRLPRRQYRLEARDRGFVPWARLRGHNHVKAVGLVNVVDQGGAVLAEFRPMAGHWSYIRRLDRNHPSNGECCGG